MKDMFYKGVKLIPKMKIEAFDDTESLLCWNEDDKAPSVMSAIGILNTPYGKRVIVYTGGWYQYCAEIPKYDKLKFKIPHAKASFKEVLKASEMSKEEFMIFYDPNIDCSGFTEDNGFDYKPNQKCYSIDSCCDACPLCTSINQETRQKWIEGVDVWKTTRDMSRLELIHYLWDRNKTECIFYFDKKHKIWCDCSGFMFRDDIDNYRFGVFQNGELTEFELPQIEIKNESK